MPYKRPYYVGTKFKPQLFYYIFGVQSTEVTISKKRHQVNEIPRGMKYIVIERDQHQEYMDAALELHPIFHWGIHGTLFGEALQRLRPCGDPVL